MWRWSSGGGDITSIISGATFNQMLKHRNDGGCPAKGFTPMTLLSQQPKLFLPSAPPGMLRHVKGRLLPSLPRHLMKLQEVGNCTDGPFAWGYCYLREQNPGSYCSPSPTYPCAPGKQYYGRGLSKFHGLNAKVEDRIGSIRDTVIYLELAMVTIVTATTKNHWKWAFGLGLWVLHTRLLLYVEAFIPKGCHWLLDVVSGVEGSTKCDMDESRNIRIRRLELHETLLTTASNSNHIQMKALTSTQALYFGLRGRAFSP
ncbi:hypothetical protein GH714_040383 [Hevea brasiliensis]|uniref:Glycoside hydrolase family 19 catalytic domain-containing protein n=1 Tax=Hevea brasiliensis TaxID=3981 RepID=A0A6A6NLN0_HEVBR|nr:hypothetical protein GH714_040383 [Hevea brasiliensis]